MDNPRAGAAGATATAEHAAKDPTLSAQLRRRELAAALEGARSLRPQYPGNRDLLYILAVSLRGLGRVAEALEVLQELEHHHPTYGRLFEERGYCHLAHGAMDAAITSFSQAVTLNPWLPASSRALRDLYRMRGRSQEAQTAARLCANLERLPGEITAAHGLFADGDIRAAEQVLRRYFETHEDHVDGMRLLARIAMTREATYEAEVLLENVLRIAPDYHAARYEYADLLFKRRKYLRAREELEKLLAVDPENRAYRLAHAHACERLGDYAQALPAYQKLLSESPEDAELRATVGYVLKTLGRTGEAIQCYRAAAALRPANGIAYWNLANLKTYRFEDAELEQMIRYETDAHTSPVDRYHLCFALGKAFEDRGEYARSFRYYERGNELKKRE